jgi:hypothetical protein
LEISLPYLSNSNNLFSTIDEHRAPGKPASKSGESDIRTTTVAQIETPTASRYS